MHSPIAVWRVSLNRMRADWPIVAAAWLIILLAATLLAAGPIYSSAVSLAGLHRTLADAPVAAVNVEVQARVDPAGATAADGAVGDELERAAGDVPLTVAWSGQSDTFALPAQADEEVTDLAVFGFADAIADHASLVGGAWPSAAAAGAPVEVAVAEPAAEALGLAVGDELQLPSRLDDELVVPVRVAGIFHVDDPADPFWWDDPQLLDGVVQSERFRTFGPFLTTPADMLARTMTGSARLTWHAFPRLDDLQVEQIGRLRAGIRALPAHLAVALPGEDARVATELDAILASSNRSLLVSRTGVLLLIIQLAVLAAYAIVLTAGLLVDHRRVDTALLRSRGAGPLQIAGMALVEGLTLAVPAALIGPWLAAAALGLLNVAGPLSEIGLGIVPQVSQDAYVAATAAAIGCALLLVLPAFLAARSFAAEQGNASRQETRTIGQRMGIDIALLAVTIIGFWQLRLYGAPLTRSVRGTLGLDPLLVAAPAIGLLAGGVLALRVMPLLAQGLERVVTRGRHLVGSLGARQLARRPLRYTRAALLLMLAMSMGVFAVSYASTWVRSQQDQADFQVGADVRVEPASGPSALPAWVLADAYTALEGVVEAVPVDRQSISISRAAGSGELLGVEPEAAARIVRFRPDQAADDVAAVLAPLRQADLEPNLTSLPGQPLRLRVTAELLITELQVQVYDPQISQFVFVAADPAELADEPILGATVVVRDADGLIHRFDADPVVVTDGVGVVEVPLAAGAPRAAAAVVASGGAPRYPLALVSIDLEMQIPGERLVTAGRTGLTSLDASDLETGQGWQAVDLDAGAGWVATRTDFQSGFAPIDAAALTGRSVEIGGALAIPGTAFTGNRSVPLSYVALDVGRLADRPLAVVANRAFLGAAAAAVGDTVSLRVDGTLRRLAIVGTLDSFPTTDPSRPLLMADARRLALLRYAATHSVATPDEWWIDTAEGRGETVAAQVGNGPFAGAEVTSRTDRTQSLSADPVALGIIGALTLGFVVAGLFAVIGLAVSAAVSARQRRTEFALLRALGLSPGQLSGWLWLENASLVFVSLVAGTLLGLLIGWVVLPFITVTQQAAAPFPPVLVELPWSSIIVLEAVSAAALAVTVVVLAALLRRIGIGSVLRMGED